MLILTKKAQNLQTQGHASIFVCAMQNIYLLKIHIVRGGNICIRERNVLLGVHCTALRKCRPGVTAPSIGKVWYMFLEQEGDG